MREAGINRRRQHHTGKRQPVRKRNDPAFFIFVGPVLNQRAHRNDKKSAAEAKRHQQTENLSEREHWKRQHAAKDGHTDAAQRNQSRFNFSAREVTSRKAPQADPDSQRRLQIAAACFVQVHDFAPVKNNYELQQSAQKPEVSVPNDRQFQCAVRPHQAPLRAQISKNVQSKFLRRVASRHASDQKTCAKSNQ
jgi:hypothetical protein